MIVRGRPSAKLAEKLEKDEKKRVEEQVKRLGPEGLEKVKKQLDEAKAEHDKPIPDEILRSFPVPDVKSIKWIPVQSVQEGVSTGIANGKTESTKLQEHLNADDTKLNFFVEFDHVQVSVSELKVSKVYDIFCSPTSLQYTLFCLWLMSPTDYDREFSVLNVGQ